MTSNEYVALMERALSEPHGLKLQFASYVEACAARKRLYKLREKALERFEVLSICHRSPCELLIFSRDKLSLPPRNDSIRPERIASAEVSDMPRTFSRPSGISRRRRLWPFASPRSDDRPHTATACRPESPAATKVPRIPSGS